MSTLRVPIAGLRGGEVTLDKDTSHYVRRVRRMVTGDRFVAFDPEAKTEAEVEVKDTSSSAVIVRVAPLRAASIVPSREVVVVQCIGKSDKLDAVVRDATELGATAIRPALSDRAVVVRKSDAALLRLRRIAVEASRQCGRGDVPHVDAPRTLDDILRDTTTDIKLVLHPAGDQDVRSIVSARPVTASISFVVGPEGGLSERELGVAVASGFVAVRLGCTILRTETAAPAMLGALLVLG